MVILLNQGDAKPRAAARNRCANRTDMKGNGMKQMKRTGKTECFDGGTTGSPRYRCRDA